MKLKAVLCDGATLRRTMKRIAHEIIEHNSDLSKVCLIGIKTRGIPFAKSLSDLIEEIEGVKIEVGTIDITSFRDDLDKVPEEETLEALPFDVTGKTVVLVDDVIYTGRTVRAAMEAIIRFGRPARIELAALVDRGHRELPIRADFIGKNVPTARSERVVVSLFEVDGKDSIELYEEDGR